MLGLAWSLGFLHSFTNVALAATPAQPGTISAHDLSWADYILDGPNISYPIPSTTLDYNSNSSILISLSNLGPVRCFRNPLPPAPTRFPPVIFNDYWEALEKIVVEIDALSILSWTFKPNDRKTWTSNGCLITVGATPSTARTVSAVFQPVVVAHLAAKVAQECFRPGQVLGGTVTFGDHQELIVALGGMRSYDADTATS